MRGSGHGVRASGGRCRVIAQALIALAACGDNAPPPRLAPAIYTYDDGTVQIDRHQLWDRQLGLLCDPRTFSDGNSYCMPAADEGFYIDEHCSRAVGKVTAGAVPVGYFVTPYQLLGQDVPSHVFRAGSPILPPTQRWEARDGQCVGPFTVFDNYDYYATGELLSDLPRVRFIDGDKVGDWQIQDLVADSIREPWRITGCEITAAPNQTTTVCAPTDAALISYFADPQCLVPVVTADDRPSLAYVDDALSGCRQYYGVGNELSTSTLYIDLNGTCLESSISGTTRYFTVAQTIQLPLLSRVAAGTSRMRPIELGQLPLVDDALFDSQLGADCVRDAGGRCIPATDARVESWFSDDVCGTPIEVAMVPTGSCAPPSTYATKVTAIYPVLEPYAQQLYQLEPGDRCGMYNPPAPFVAHSIGPALGAEAFAHATLVIE